LSCGDCTGKTSRATTDDYYIILIIKKDYVSTRKVVRFKEMSHEQRKEYIEKHPEYGRIICRCETISEGEIIDAIRRSPKPVSLDGIKRRCKCRNGKMYSQDSVDLEFRNSS